MNGWQAAIMTEVAVERDRQDAKWGAENIVNRGMEWGLAVLVEEVGEVARATLEERAQRAMIEGKPGATWRVSATETADEHRAQARKELIHVAAVAIAMAEAMDRAAHR